MSLHALLRGAGCAVLAYLGMSFTQASFDLRMWDEGERFATIMAALLTFCLWNAVAEQLS